MYPAPAYLVAQLKGMIGSPSDVIRGCDEGGQFFIVKVPAYAEGSVGSLPARMHDGSRVIVHIIDA
jgi:hypothetical protein